ncbi:MAG: helix-turn-helix domain-containing protein [Microcoleus sp.]
MTAAEKRVGATLARIREDSGLTQKQVASATNLCQRTISFVERGDRPTLIRHVVAMAESMGYQLLFVPVKKEIK